MPKAEQPPLEKLDPVKAWEPWEPDDKNPWNMKWAGHLYRRAGFGASLPELRDAVSAGLDKTFDRLVKGPEDAEETYTFLLKTGEQIARRNEPYQLRGWWLYTMIHTPRPFTERMTLFWHNHFATSIAKVNRTVAMFKQNLLLRQHALGKFHPFLLDMSKDVAMLVWLDSNSNVKGKPNENYAREVMELFSLGVGNYTEKDIREAARAFTGWHTDGEKFDFASKLHDEDEKTVLGKKGNLNGEDVVAVCLEQKACARFLVKKLYREFISETVRPPQEFLEPLAERLRKSDYDLGDLMNTMLRSKHFFSDYAYRQRVKSPVEYVLGAVRAVGQGFVSPQSLVTKLEAMGQQLFAPPNVKGWEGGRSWLNTATVLARHNFAQTLTVGSGQLNLGDPETKIAVVIDPSAIVRREKITEPRDIVALLLDLLVQGQIDEDQRTKLVNFVAEGKPQGPALDQRVRETVHTIMTMPEYQLA